MKSKPLTVKSVILRVVRVALAAYLGVVMLMFLFQSRLVFVPSREISVTPKEVGLEFEEVRFKSADGTVLSGWFVPAKDARATVLYCHGNGGNISDRLDTLSVLNGLGLNVFMFDYRGYGLSEGKPTEKGTYEDAEGAWKYLTEVRKEPAERIIICGHSLGGAIAAHLARDHAPGAVVLESTFPSMLDMGRRLYPWLPVRWLLRFKFDTAEYLAGHKYPLLMVHSVEDGLVPYEMGRRLFEGAGEPKEFLEIRGGHDDGFMTSGRVYTDGWNRFLNQYLPRPPQGG